MEDRVGRCSVPEATALSGALDRLDRERVELLDGLRVLEAVGEHLLAVHDLAGIGQAREDRAPGNLVQVLVAGCHHVPERLQLEILRQCAEMLGWGEVRVTCALAGASCPEDVAAAHDRLVDRIPEFRDDLEVAIRVHEEDLHEAIRSFSRS